MHDPVACTARFTAGPSTNRIADRIAERTSDRIAGLTTDRTAGLVTRRGFGAALAALPLAALAEPAPLQPMLSQPAPAGVDPAGYLVSEKYDGVRALWDGRQLRFRSGLSVAVPAWFAARLPAVPLDGELWLARGRFDALSGSVRRTTPDDAEWRALRYMVFDLPGGQAPFAARAAALHDLCVATAWPQLVAVAQQAVDSRDALQRRLAAVVAAGGEGLVLHRADARWAPGRSSAVLKLKPLDDAEAQVVGHQPGRGRHVGRMGALQLRGADGQRFLLGTGFNDAQRVQPPAVGSWVTYTHRGRTPQGLPRFASFLRVRDV